MAAPTRFKKALPNGRVTGFAIAQDGKSSKQHEIFVLDVSWASETWRCYKRYSMFEHLNKLVKGILHNETPAFPGKGFGFFSNHDAEFLQKRQQDLNTWLKRVCVSSVRKRELKDYLYAFLHDQSTKTPPVGLGHIISSGDLADPDSVDDIMAADKAKVSQSVSAADVAAERKAEERRQKREEMERDRAAKKKRLQELKARRDYSLRLLKRGSWFLKHGRRGRPKKKFVLVETEQLLHSKALALVWKTTDGSGNRHGRGTKRREVAFAKIIRVVAGKSAGLLQDLDASDVEGDKSFSLVLDDADKGSLDLTADSAKLRDEWVQAFQVILGFETRRASIAAAGKALYNLTMEDKKNSTKQVSALDKMAQAKDSAQKAEDAVRLRQQKMSEAEMASKRLADRAGDFESAAKRVHDQQGSGLFGTLATAWNGE